MLVSGSPIEPGIRIRIEVSPELYNPVSLIEMGKEIP
jgi:hypothetical protein